MKARALFLSLAAVAVVVTACSSTPVGPLHLIVTLEVSADTVQPGDSLFARLVIFNPTMRTVTLTGTCAPIATLTATKDGQTVPMVGANMGECLTVNRQFELLPNRQFERIFPLVAMFENLQLGEQVAAPPGTYKLHTRIRRVGVPDRTVSFHVAGS